MSTSRNKHHDDCSVEMESEEQATIAQTENKAVGCLKIVVMLVLIASTVFVSATTYSHLSSSENKRFTTQFDDEANKVMDAIGQSLDRTFGLMDSVAVLVVSHARATNQTWPMVTVPDFALRLSKILPLTDAFLLTVLPKVTPSTRRSWEQYAMQHDDWIDESVAVQESWRQYYGPTGPAAYGVTKYPAIYGGSGVLPSNHARDMLPNWLTFPAIPNTTLSYNYDFLNISLQDAYKTCLLNYTTSISVPYMIPTPGNEVEEQETLRWAEYFKPYLAPDEDPVEPVSDLSLPIVDQVKRVEFNGMVSNEYKPVGMIVAAFYWRAVMRQILPEDADGLHIVFDNKCVEKSFTYMIKGPKVEYMGVGDRHEHQYNHMVMERKLFDLSKLSNHGSAYTGPELSQTHCPFTLRLFPSKELEGRFKTNQPVALSVAAAMIFVFTSLVFFFYDFMVERRQKTVLHTAVQSSAIVSSLFPTTVRDQLYPTMAKSATGGTMTKSFFSGTDVAGSIEPSSKDAVKGPPIASLYTDTTVLFADVAGFTEWSSGREPTAVFTLLETIYASFDDIAKQHGIFKVETIGDCYLAVAGLPTPRKAHAVAMAKFACDCRNQMQELVLELESTLGPGTAQLALRIGLNSGPTTAGVLRGEKSRFQVFGDTVNTAARMESNGERNRIHVSEKTAELLIEAGKGHWLTRREDEVFCKGKGVMNTYWCELIGETDKTPSVNLANAHFAV